MAKKHNKTIRAVDIEDFDAQINKFCDENDVNAWQIQHVVEPWGAEMKTVHYACLCYVMAKGEGKMEEPVWDFGPNDPRMGIDMSKWKHDDPNNYWTRDVDTKVEQRVGLSEKTKKWFYCRIVDGKKTWADVVSVDTKKHTIVIKPRQ